MSAEIEKRTEELRPEDEAHPDDTVQSSKETERVEIDATALIDRIQRLQAEFENYKKRAAREFAQQEERAIDRVLLDILPLYDGLELAFDNYNRDTDAEAFVTGVKRIFAQFEQILESKDVRRIESIGTPFDPAIHEALLSLPSEEKKNNIVEEFSPGYVRDGRTLRPSKVGVSQGAAPANEEEE